MNAALTCAKRAAPHLAAAWLALTLVEGFAQELPSRVKLADFALDATEITIGQFRRFARATGRQTKAEREGGGYEYDAGWEQRPGWVWATPYGRPADPREPAVHLTWHEAKDYCAWAGGALLTLEEWLQAGFTELRQRPTDGFETGRRYRYPVGDSPAGMNTSSDDPWPRHARTGMTRRGVNGLYDMGANVWEWLADEQGDRALTAGGSWWYGPYKTREDGVQYKPKAFAAVYIGFRCRYPIAEGRG